MGSIKHNTWFISDVHFGHSGVLYYHPQRREAAGITLEELQTNKKEAVRKHDEWLINLWNETIKKDDVVYFLGDFSWYNKEDTEKLLGKLNGKKFLIRGNHDKPLQGLERYFVWVGDIKEAKFNHDEYDFIDPNETFCIEMCHYPMLSWNRKQHGTVHAHGHCHGSLDFLNRFKVMYILKHSAFIKRFVETFFKIFPRLNKRELRVDVGLDASLADYQFIDIKKLYDYFCDIRNKTGFKTFGEYVEWIMGKQKLRM